jgi:hypothetical protein
LQRMIVPALDFVFEAGKLAARLAGVTDREDEDKLADLNTDEIAHAWLIKANERYRTESIPPRRRPFEALLDYTRENNGAISFRSPACDRVFDWFQQRSLPEAHHIGALFTGSYFYDAYFWPVTIGVGWGQFTLDPLQALDTMPEPLKRDLVNDQEELRIYLLYWADCVDYAYGLDDIRSLNRLSPRALSFVNNADKELRAAIAQVNTPRPNPRAMLSSRMAIEIFLKGLLVAKSGATDSGLRKLGHDLVRACDALRDQGCNAAEIEIIKHLAHTLPDVSDRYTGEDQDMRLVGNALTLCQVAATMVIRQLTDRDIRPQLFVPEKPQAQ